MDEGRRSIFWAPFVPEPGWGAQDSRLFTICFTIFFSFKFIFYLENNCFTVLCWFLSYNNMDQP